MSDDPPIAGPPPRANRIELDVRFREVDSYAVVWHGHYIDWMEAARNQYAAAFGYRIAEEQERGYAAPMLELTVGYRKGARLGDRVAVEARLDDDPRRVIAFRYRICREPGGELLATGRTVQAVVGPRGLLLDWPPRLRELLASLRTYEASLPAW